MRTVVSHASAAPPGQARPPIAHSTPLAEQRPTATQLVPDRHRLPRHGSDPRGDPPGATHARLPQNAPRLPAPPHWASLVQTLAGSAAGKNDRPTPRPVDLGSRRKLPSASVTIAHLLRPATSWPIDPELSTSSSNSSGTLSARCDCSAQRSLPGLTGAPSCAPPPSGKPKPPAGAAQRASAASAAMPPAPPAPARAELGPFTFGVSQPLPAATASTRAKCTTVSAATVTAAARLAGVSFMRPDSFGPSSWPGRNLVIALPYRAVKSYRPWFVDSDIV